MSRWPPESSSSSRSPSARSPSGPGFSALMNIEVIEHGPEISIPGLLSSSGTGGTRQSPVVAALGGGWPGMTCSRSARRSPSARRARSSSTRAPSASCRRARYSQNAGVNSSAAPSTAANLTRVASTAMILLAYPTRALFAWRPRGCQWQNGPRSIPPLRETYDGHDLVRREGDHSHGSRGRVQPLVQRRARATRFTIQRSRERTALQGARGRGDVPVHGGVRAAGRGDLPALHCLGAHEDAPGRLRRQVRRGEPARPIRLHAGLAIDARRFRGMGRGRARDGDARRTRRRGGRNVMVNVLTVVATLSAKPGKGDELAAILREQVAAVRKAEPDCLVYRLHRSKKNPDLFLFYEQYRSDAAFDAHRKAPHLAAFRARRDPLVAGPPEVELYLAVTD